MPLPPSYASELVSWQGQRRFAIRAQSSCDRSCDAFVARVAFDYNAGLPAAERKAIFRKAAAERRRVERDLKARSKKDEKARGQISIENQCRYAPRLDGEGQVESENQRAAALSVCLPVIVNTIRSRESWDRLRETAEAAMRAIARSLPVWERVAQIPGFGDLGLAVLVAEAGDDLSAYPHHEHLWSRLGLAPFQGKAGSTWRRSGGLTKQQWTDEFRYNPIRRGTIAGDVGLPLFFAKSSNAYGAVYTARRAHTASTRPEWTALHSHNDARRIMTKALVKDVWRAWRDRAS